jgi:predicted neuraminidase
MRTPKTFLVFLALLVPAVAGTAVGGDAPVYHAELVFPLRREHNHAPGLVECPNGDLIASWYRGSGERGSDDVAVYGARLRHGASQWSSAFLMADFPGFPDCNTCLMIDPDNRLWLSSRDGTAGSRRSTAILNPAHSNVSKGKA